MNTFSHAWLLTWRWNAASLSPSSYLITDNRWMSINLNLTSLSGFLQVDTPTAHLCPSSPAVFSDFHFPFSRTRRSVHFCRVALWREMERANLHSSDPPRLLPLLHSALPLFDPVGVLIRTKSSAQYPEWWCGMSQRSQLFTSNNKIAAFILEWEQIWRNFEWEFR